MENKIHEFKMKIIESHLDFFGHVNNAVYLQLFEEARWDLITERGFGADAIMKAKQGPVILSVEMQFQKELKLREDIVITTEALNYDRKVGRLQQKMKKADGSIACQAVFAFGLFDLRERKLIEATPEWLHACGWKPSS